MGSHRSFRSSTFLVRSDLVVFLFSVGEKRVDFFFRVKKKQETIDCRITRVEIKTSCWFQSP